MTDVTVTLCDQTIGKKALSACGRLAAEVEKSTTLAVHLDICRASHDLVAESSAFLQRLRDRMTRIYKRLVVRLHRLLTDLAAKVAERRIDADEADAAWQRNAKHLCLQASDEMHETAETMIGNHVAAVGRGLRARFKRRAKLVLGVIGLAAASTAAGLAVPGGGAAAVVAAVALMRSAKTCCSNTSNCFAPLGSSHDNVMKQVANVRKKYLAHAKEHSIGKRETAAAFCNFVFMVETGAITKLKNALVTFRARLDEVERGTVKATRKLMEINAKVEAVDARRRELESRAGALSRDERKTLARLKAKQDKLARTFATAFDKLAEANASVERMRTAYTRSYAPVLEAIRSGNRNVYERIEKLRTGLAVVEGLGNAAAGAATTSFDSIAQLATLAVALNNDTQTALVDRA